MANNVILNNRSDLASHAYGLVFDIKEFQPKTWKPIWKTHVVNMYDNSIGQGYI